jgi:hypothetical protein
MYLTWIAIIASLLMGLGAVLIFIFAVRQDYFRNIEEAKYQVFWPELEELVETSGHTESIGPIKQIKEDRNDRGEQSQIP